VFGRKQPHRKTCSSHDPSLIGGDCDSEGAACRRGKLRAVSLTLSKRRDYSRCFFFWVSLHPGTGIVHALNAISKRKIWAGTIDSASHRRRRRVVADYKKSSMRGF